MKNVQTLNCKNLGIDAKKDRHPCDLCSNKAADSRAFNIQTSTTAQQPYIHGRNLPVCPLVAVHGTGSRWLIRTWHRKEISYFIKEYSLFEKRLKVGKRVPNTLIHYHCSGVFTNFFFRKGVQGVS